MQFLRFKVVFLPLYVLTSKVVVVKYCLGKGFTYNFGPQDASIVVTVDIPNAYDTLVEIALLIYSVTVSCKSVVLALSQR